MDCLVPYDLSRINLICNSISICILRYNVVNGENTRMTRNEQIKQLLLDVDKCPICEKFEERVPIMCYEHHKQFIQKQLW
jgi:hypothetical protein